VPPALSQRPPDPAPGDLIGFSDPGPIGTAINLATWGVPGWGLSHVGIVADHPDYDRPLLWESTTLADRDCLIAKRRTRGVQAHFLWQRIDEFSGRVWHYRLRRPLCQVPRPTGSPAGGDLTAYVVGQLGTDYDALGAFRSRATPLALLERWFCVHPENLASLFCSEFTAAAWFEAGVWSIRSASNWSPNALARAAVRRRVCLQPLRIK
jgi:hypothetical protein